MEVQGFSAADLSTIGGIATVSLLHSFIPTHWLPFSIVGRAQKWTLSRTLLVSTPSFLSFPFPPFPLTAIAKYNNRVLFICRSRL